MTNEEMVEQIQQGVKEEEYMTLLYGKNIGILHKLARKYSAFAEYEDLLQEGYFGLYEAVRRYHPGEARFLSYAVYWIEQAMQRYAENTGKAVRIPSFMRQRLIRSKKAVSFFRQEYGRPPTEKELCFLLHVSSRQLRELEAITAIDEIVSLDKLRMDEKGRESGYDAPCRENLEEETVDRIIREDMKTGLWEIVRENTTAEQDEVIRCRYRENMTLKQTGERIGAGIERARQIEAAALRGLRAPKIKRLLNERYEVAMETAYRGSLASFRYTWCSSVERAVLKME